MKITSKGHYLISISKSYEALNEFDENNTKSILLSTENASNRKLKQKQSIAEKLHKQFGQASTNKTLKLIKLPGIVDQELVDLINEIGEKCTVCLKYKKVQLKPVVGFSLSQHFNDVISMDLKEINGFRISHLIDHATRYSAATIVKSKSKQKEEIIKAIFKIWITLFGPPNEILSDNGGEFDSDLLRDLPDLLNVFIRTTPGESPRSNGISEKYNAILGNMIKKLLIDKSIIIQLILLLHGLFLPKMTYIIIWYSIGIQ